MNALSYSGCFSYPWLCQYASDNSDENGNCDYFGREGIDLIPIGTLYETRNNFR